MLKELQKELTEALIKRDELLMWMKEHTQHPDFIKIVSDKNHLQVKIQALEFKISQIEASLPPHGEKDSFGDTTLNIQINQHQILIN